MTMTISNGRIILNVAICLAVHNLPASVYLHYALAKNFLTVFLVYLSTPPPSLSLFHFFSVSIFFSFSFLLARHHFFLHVYVYLTSSHLSPALGFCCVGRHSALLNQCDKFNSVLFDFVASFFRLFFVSFALCIPIHSRIGRSTFIGLTECFFF